MYIKAVLNEFLFPDTGADPEIRARLERMAKAEGPAALHARLAVVDPVTADRLHVNDVRRVIRALELYERTGQTMTEHIAAAGATESPYRVVKVGLTRDRERLYQRINARVCEMVNRGLVEEAARLYESGCLQEGSVAAQALGYKEMREYLTGRCTLEEAIARLQQATRRYAKRQYTWFRRERDIHWFDLDRWGSVTEAAALIEAYVRTSLNWEKRGSIPQH